MATENRGSVILPKVGEYDIWPRAVKIDRLIVAATSSDGDEDVVLGTGTTTGTQDVQLWAISAGTLIYKVGVVIETAFTAAVTMEVGDTTTIDGWIDTLQVAATSTNDQLWIFSTGSADTAETPQYAKRGGRYYGSTGTIELDVSGAAAAVGRALFFIEYAQLSS